MARRVLIVFIVFLLIGPIIGLLIGGSSRNEVLSPTTTTGPPAIRPVAPPAVNAQLPRDRVVRAHVGDLVTLEVMVNQPDSVEIPVLGLSESAAPGAPAQFDFIPDRPGRLDVQLSISDANVGRVLVSPRPAATTTPTR